MFNLVSMVLWFRTGAVENVLDPSELARMEVGRFMRLSPAGIFPATAISIA